MKRFPVPTRTEQEDFLIRLYFGAGSEYLPLCIRRAYRDFSRTLEGIGRMTDLYQPASTEVENALVELKGSVKIASQEAFDDWHRASCNRLCSTYAQHRYNDFYIGHAQKWLNMSFKYIYVIGDTRVPGYNPLYQFGHVPLDRIIIERFQPYNPPKLSTASWTRLEDYEEYLRFQQWIRDTFTGSIPLAVEFHLFQEADV